MKQTSAHQRTLLLIMLVAATFLAALPFASASGITCRRGDGCLNAWDSFDWFTNYGPPFSRIPNDSIAVSNRWVEAQVHFAGGWEGQRRDQDNGWMGNFAPGDALLWTNYPGQGPLTFTFQFPVAGVGANIQSDSWGAFTALIQAFDINGHMIDSFSENGDSNSNGDGSAIFIGLFDRQSPIKSVTFSITSCTQECNDFAINQMDLLYGGCIGPECVNPEPEPASLLLVGSGLFGMAGFLRKRIGRHFGI